MSKTMKEGEGKEGKEREGEDKVECEKEVLGVIRKGR